MILSPQQQKALKELLGVARIATSGAKAELPILPRTHSLLVGPSGSGKSHLARELGVQLGIPALVINVATWLPTGTRSGQFTVSLIAAWLNRLPGCGVLVLDEIDKLQSNQDWIRYVRLEIHDLLDGILPASTELPDESLPAECFPQGTEKHKKEELERTLRERLMIVGCGAWQSAWRSNSKSMGFSNGNETSQPEPLSNEQIASAIDPELRQRFRDKIVILPTMQAADYMQVAEEIARVIPPELLTGWEKKIDGVLSRAVESSLGMRAFEELLLESMVLAEESKGFQEEVIQKPLKPVPPVQYFF